LRYRLKSRYFGKKIPPEIFLKIRLDPERGQYLEKRTSQKFF